LAKKNTPGSNAGVHAFDCLFFAALFYHAEATLRYLEQSSYTQSFFTRVFEESVDYVHTVERKSFILGMISVLTVRDFVPEYVKENLKEILIQIIAMMNR
jgi:hypothetical protein